MEYRNAEFVVIVVSYQTLLSLISRGLTDDAQAVC